MKKEVLGIVFLVVLLGAVSAEFEVGNVSHIISTEYGPGANLQGWLNISFFGEPINTLFSDSAGNKITLDSVLTSDPSYTTECQTNDCMDDYTYDLGNTSIGFMLNKNIEHISGFVLHDYIEEILDFDFTISSNASSSCTNQLKINFLLNNDDETYDFGNIQTDTELCTEVPVNYSCFNPALPTSNPTIDRKMYCQKYIIPESPGIKVGAWIKKIYNRDDIIKIFLYEGTEGLASCEIDDISMGFEGNVSCEIPYLFTEEKEYHLCLFSNINQTDWEDVYQTKRTIQGINPGEGCGRYGISPSSYDTAYPIFFQPLKFKSFGTMKVDGSTNISKMNMTSYITNLLRIRYGEKNCDSSGKCDLDCKGGCVVPMKFISTQSGQFITVDEISLKYIGDQGRDTKYTIHTIDKGPARKSSDFQLLDLGNAGFKMPTKKEETLYSMYLGGQLLFRENITIGNVPIIHDVAPKKASLGYSTKFRANVSVVGANISKYVWKFDNTPITTTVNEASFTFTTIGPHNLTLTAVDTKNKNSTKKYTIQVNSPKAQIEEDLKKFNESIKNLEEDIDSLGTFEKQVVNSIINIGSKKELVADAHKKFNSAVNDSHYLEILGILEDIEIPNGITQTENSSYLIFFPKERRIDLDSVENITGSTYKSSRSEDYKSAILTWNQEFIETKVKFKKLSASGSFGPEHLVSFWDISTRDKTSRSVDAHLYINKFDDLEFKSTYGAIDSDYFKVIRLDGSENAFTFSTTEDIEYEDLPVFISPPLSALNLGVQTGCSEDSECGDGEYCSEDGVCLEDSSNKWVFFGLAILFLIIIAFVVYAVLFNWYKNKYETHLFKDRNNLFNLVTYINHQNKKGLSDSEIENNLKKAKWNGEQITYAMKKFNGENTGMFELPFLKMIFGKKNRAQAAAPGRRPRMGIMPGRINPRKRFNPRKR